MVAEAQLQYRQLPTSASRKYFPDLFQWYLTSYNKIKDLLLAFNSLSRENESHFYSHFVGNAIECIVGIGSAEKTIRREKYLEICQNELLQIALPFYQSKRTKGIIKALKQQNIDKLIRSVKNYLFWANVRKKIRSLL